MLRTLSYTIYFLVFTLLVGSCWGQKQAPRNGIHTSRSSSAPLSFTITPESACLWVSRQEPPVLPTLNPKLTSWALLFPEEMSSVNRAAGRLVAGRR